MKFTAKQIADLLQGTVEGDPQASVQTFAKIEEGVEGAISFLANPHYEHYIYDTKSSVVLVNQDFAPSQPVSATLIRVPNAYEAIARLLAFMRAKLPSVRAFTRRLALIHRQQLARIATSVLSYISVKAQLLATVRRFMPTPSSRKTRRWAATACSIPMCRFITTVKSAIA